MADDKLRALQLRLGKKSSDSFIEWYDNQANANESCKSIIEHFVRMHGTKDIDSDEIQIKMAKDLLNSRGKIFNQQVETAETNNQVEVDYIEQNEVIPNKVVEDIQPIIEAVAKGEKSQEVKEIIPINNRGDINI